MITDLTLSAIKAEGMAQDAKWGEQNHEPEIWLAILTEEVGELAQAMLADRFDNGRDEKLHDSHHVSMEIEAIQVAAVAAHFVEFLARRSEVRHRALVIGPFTFTLDTPEKTKMDKPADELINRDEDKGCPTSFYRDGNCLDCDLQNGHESELHWDDVYKLWWCWVG